MVTKMHHSIPRKILNGAIKFHGHLGVFLVLGLKAGLYAKEKLENDSFKMYACIETKPFPPFSCFIDGVQVTTGCTMGKMNIELKNGNSILVRFTKGGSQLTLMVKPDLLEEITNISSINENRKLALSLIKKPIEDLFQITY